MEKKEKALLVVDMLNDFLDEKGTLYCGEEAREIIPNVVDAVRRAREQGALIVWIRDAHKPDDREFSLFGPHCVRGTWGADIIPELAGEKRPEDVVIEKSRYSAFFGTDLDGVLHERGVKKVEVVGVCTSICVMETVRDLRDRDYEVRVHRDCVRDFDEEAHGFALRRMEKILGAHVL